MINQTQYGDMFGEQKKTIEFMNNQRKRSIDFISRLNNQIVKNNI